MFLSFNPEYMEENSIIETFDEVQRKLRFKQSCRQIDALSFLPKGFVKAGMQHLKDICPADTVDLLRYFEKT